jgi:hypothetical protein
MPVATIAGYTTVSTTLKTDKKTSQDLDIIKSSLLMHRLFTTPFMLLPGKFSTLNDKDGVNSYASPS